MTATPTESRPTLDLEERLRAGAFLLIDKPRGPTSHQVTAWVRDLLGVERAGHAGTLDPNVSGLLWIGVGPALKLIPLVLEFPKRYVGVVALHAPVPRPAVEATLREFVAPVYQTPPVRSAVKRERRVRRIHSIDLVEMRGPRLLLDVRAESGTYLRTLAVDVGEALGVDAHLEELRRVGNGPFEEHDAVTLTELGDAVADWRAGDPDPLARRLHPLREVWGDFPSIVLKDAAASAVAHGANLARGGIRSIRSAFPRDATVALVDGAGELVATGRALVGSDDLRAHGDGWIVDTERVFADPGRYPPRWKRAGAEPSRAMPEPSGPA